MLEDFILKCSKWSIKILDTVELPIEQFLYFCSGVCLFITLLLLVLNRKSSAKLANDSQEQLEEKSVEEKIVEQKDSTPIEKSNKEASVKAPEETVLEKDEKSSKSKNALLSPSSSVSYQAGLQKSRTSIISKVSTWFKSNKKIDKENAREFEEILISADMGVATSKRIVETILENSDKDTDFRQSIKDNLIEILSDSNPAGLSCENHNPLIILIVGVNGAGKTTTIAKLSRKFKSEGKRVLVSAGDTFRAAAVEQLKHWADKIEIDIEYKLGENIKPATVVYDTIARLKKEKQDVLIIDTAGRLHNRVNLMNELESIKKIIQKDFEGAPHETILVLDGSSGQNALQQAREFNQRVDISGLIITKLDGTSKGGIVVAIKDELGVPIQYVGLGEGEFDLKEFNAKEYVDAIFGDEKLEIDFASNTEEVKEDITKEVVEESSSDEGCLEKVAVVAEEVTTRRVVRRRKS